MGSKRKDFFCVKIFKNWGKMICETAIDAKKPRVGRMQDMSRKPDLHNA